MLVASTYGDSDSDSDQHENDCVLKPVVSSTTISRHKHQGSSFDTTSKSSDAISGTTISAKVQPALFNKTKLKKKKRTKNAKKILLRKLLAGLSSEELNTPTEMSSSGHSQGQSNSILSNGTSMNDLLRKLPQPKHATSKRKATSIIDISGMNRSKQIRKVETATHQEPKVKESSFSSSSLPTTIDSKTTTKASNAETKTQTTTIDDDYDPAAAYSVSNYYQTTASHNQQQLFNEESTSNKDKSTSSKKKKDQYSDLPPALARDMQRFGGSINEVVIDVNSMYGGRNWTPDMDTSIKKTAKPSLTTKVWNAETGEISTHNNTSRMAKSKHSIGWMAAQASEMELEMAIKRSKGFQTKAQTQAKYGW